MADVIQFEAVRNRAMLALISVDVGEGGTAVPERHPPVALLIDLPCPRVAAIRSRRPVREVGEPVLCIPDPGQPRLGVAVPLPAGVMGRAHSVADRELAVPELT